MYVSQMRKKYLSTGLEMVCWKIFNAEIGNVVGKISKLLKFPTSVCYDQYIVKLFTPSDSQRV